MRIKFLLFAATLLLGGVLWAQTQPAAEPSTQSPTAQDTSPIPDASTPSLVDAARQKSTDKKAKRVFTNDEIPSRAPEAAAADVAPSKEAAPAEASKSADGSGEKNPPKQDEESVEVRGAKKVVEAKNIQIDAVNNELQKLQSDLANAKTPDEASSIAQSIRNLQHNLQVWTNVRDDAQKVIDAGNKPKPQ